jgi:hypothetical protein
MDVPGRLDTAAAAGRLAAFGLPGGSSEAVEIPEPAWPALLRFVIRQRITGLASAGVRAGSLRLAEAQRDELAEHHREAMAMVLLLQHLTLEVSSAMEDAGVPAVVLKGAAIATSFYPDPSWRSYGDLDLLVSVADWSAACHTLTSLGFGRITPEPRPGFDERFGKGASFEDARGLQVDLHRTLALGPFGLWIDTEALLEGTTRFTMRGASLRRLDDTNALIHACVHAALGRERPLLVPLRDVLQIAWSGRADQEVLSARVRDWRLIAPVSYALKTAAETLAAPLPVTLQDLRRIRAGAIERRALQAYTTDRRRRGGMSLSTLWAIPGIRPRAAYVRALLFPDRKFLDARAGDGSGSLRSRLMIPMRWALGRIQARRRAGRNRTRRSREATPDDRIERSGD